MANLFQVSFIIFLSIGGGFNNLIAQKVGLWVPMGEVINTLDYKKRREGPSFGINVFDYRNPFPVTRLNKLAFALLISTRNYYWGVNNAYYKTGLIKVIEIVIGNAVFCLYIINQLESRVNKLRIFAGGSLKIVYAI